MANIFISSQVFCDVYLFKCPIDLISSILARWIQLESSLVDPSFPNRYRTGRKFPSWHQRYQHATTWRLWAQTPAGMQPLCNCRRPYPCPNCSGRTRHAPSSDWSSVRRAAFARLCRRSLVPLDGSIAITRQTSRKSRLRSHQVPLAPVKTIRLFTLSTIRVVITHRAG